MSNARESKKETGKGGKILVTSNEGKSKKEKGKGDKISLKSNWRMNEREQEKIDAEQDATERALRRRGCGLISCKCGGIVRNQIW